MNDITVQELGRILGILGLEYKVGPLQTTDSTTYYNSIVLLNTNQVKPTEPEIRAQLNAVRLRLKEERANQEISSKYTLGKVIVLLGKALDGDLVAKAEVRSIIAYYESIP